MSTLSLTSFLVAGVSLGVAVACDNSPDNGAGYDSAPAQSSGGSSSSGDQEPYAGAPSRGGASASGGSQPASGGVEQTPAGGAPDVDMGGDGGVSASGAGGEAACVPAAPTLPKDVPGTIAAPQGAVLLRHFHAVGTQNYQCTMKPGDQGAAPTYAWAFIGPKADMLNSCGTKVGIHFAVPDSAPPAPEWQYDVDGSSVIGEKVDASPVAGAIPELLLKQAGHGGNGVFSQVTFVQRLATAGGAAPDAATCNADHVDDEQDVGYTAEYYFYSGGT